MPRFAILQHDHPFLHWDLLLEDGNACRTWRLLTEPMIGAEIRAERLSDHRLHYLEYEGPVSGDRGVVVRIDAGMFEWVLDEPSEIEVKLLGSRLADRCQIQPGGDDCRVSFLGS